MENYREMIAHTLEETNGKQVKAAEILCGIG